MDAAGRYTLISLLTVVLFAIWLLLLTRTRTRPFSLIFIAIVFVGGVATVSYALPVDGE